MKIDREIAEQRATRTFVVDALGGEEGGGRAEDDGEAERALRCWGRAAPHGHRASGQEE
jgi:hypothetical protein